MQDYKSLCAAVMICATLVYRQTHIHTRTHTHTDSISLAYMKSSAI